MASERPITPGRFVWHEINTQNPEASRVFYSELFGWTFDTHDADYVHITAGGEAVGGMMKAPAPFIPTHWLPYVSVEDVDAGIKRATSAGCALIAGPMEVDAGRFVIMRDPQGALFQLWRSRRGDPPEVTTPARGSFCWDELYTSDPDAALAVYAKTFGWTRVPAGSDPSVSLLMRGERRAGSMVKAPPGVPSHWLAYVVVDQLAAARERAKKLGGKILVEREDIPGIGAFSVLQDTLGAVIAAFESAR